MVVPRYDDATCAKPGTNYDMWHIQGTITKENKAAQRACLSCPVRLTCHEALMSAPQLYEGQIRAAQAVTHGLVRQLSARTP